MASPDTDFAQTLKFRVTGRVQGVFFRASTREQAERLGISGYARNQADGSVEVLACGSGAALGDLAEWLKSGPRLAAVETVSAEPSEETAASGFSIA